MSTSEDKPLAESEGLVDLVLDEQISEMAPADQEHAEVCLQQELMDDTAHMREKAFGNMLRVCNIKQKRASPPVTKHSINVLPGDTLGEILSHANTVRAFQTIQLSSKKIMKANPGLKHVELGKYMGPFIRCDNHVGDDELAHMVAGCPRLERLKLLNLQNVTDDGLKHIARGCSRIEHLIVEGLENVTDDGLKHIGRSCQRLEHLQLRYLQNVTGDGLKHIARGCSCLESLNLKGLGNELTVVETYNELEHIAQEHIAHACPRLELYYC